MFGGVAIFERSAMNQAIPDVAVMPGKGRWKSLSAPQLEREYSPSSCIGGNYQPFIAAYQTQSRQAFLKCNAMGAKWQELRYGAKPAQRIDLCIPAAKAQSSAKPGLLVFIHGGYWQALSAQDSLFAASGCIQRGLAFAAIDYSLAPQASVAEIVGECRAALLCLVLQSVPMGFDSQNIVVAGSSAGAHLAAMVAWPGWLGAEGGATVRVRAAVLVSGIFDLEPLVGTSINGALALDAGAARKVSPMGLPLADFPPTLVVWGAVETHEFKRQSREFAGALLAGGTPCETAEIPERNHFDVILDLADANSWLGQRTFELFGAD